MKRLFLGVMIAIITLALTLPAFAETSDIIAEDPENMVSLTLSLEVPDEFNYDVEFLIGMMSYHMGPTYTNDRTYRADTVIEPGNYSVSVICPQDLEKRFSFEGPSSANIAGPYEITYHVVAGPEEINDDEEGDIDKNFEDEEGLFVSEPQRYDFAPSEVDCGTIRVECEFCAALKSVTYRLSGADQVYDIVLTRDAGFVAEAELPVGNYKETTTINVEFDEDVLYNDKLSFAWQHNDRPTFWGAYYGIEKDKTIEINDLAVVMIYNGETTKVNSNVLFAPKYKEAYDNAIEENREELLESAGVTIEESAEYPTIPELEPQIPEITEPEDTTNILGYMVVIGTVILIIIVILILMVRKHRKNKK